MSMISANELKTKGTAAIANALKNHDEAIISVRGKRRYVVMDIEHFDYLRECELTAALEEAKNDIKAGHFTRESAASHFKKLKAAL